MSENGQVEEARYTGVAILLHWLMALLILGSFTLGLTMVDMKFSPTKLKYFSWHKWIGVTVFLLLLLRLLWRSRHPAPPLPLAMPRWQQTGAHVSHLLLYALLFIVPLSGWLYTSAAGVPVVYLGLIPLPDLVETDKALAEQLKTLHHFLDWTLLAVVILHSAAALKHHFLDRDNVLRRMLPRRRGVSVSSAQPPQESTS